MKRSISTLLVVLTALATTATAAARPADPLRNAKLRSAAGTLAIVETRCPAGAQPGSSDCGTARLDANFAAPKAVTRAQAGQPGFPLGVRITGAGSGACSAESPNAVISGPDGSMQILSGASRVQPGTFVASRLAIAGGRRGVRIAWLEPLAPGLTCDYFGEPDTGLALPGGQVLPRTLVSPLVSARALKRARFTVTIAGSQQWAEHAADGTQVTGTASWHLRLDYKR